jgi:SagB-type dehydrogenase family enzyme
VTRNTDIALPAATIDGPASFEANLGSRRSVREFGTAALPLATVAQLLWAAQGVTSPAGERTAPSAGALYPLELYLVAGNVEGIGAGIYRYRPPSHALRPHLAGDHRRALAEAALGQSAVRTAAAVLVIAAVYGRTSVKYGARADRYVHMEAGHAAQNVYLQAESLRLGTVIVGAFEDERVRDALALPEREMPLVLMPVGARRVAARR